MAKPQLENGHTRIANEILEHLMKVHLSPNQWQVLLCIIRKTYGFQKKVDYIANSQIIEATGLCKAVVSRTLRKLNEMNMISRNSKYIGIQKDWERWEKLAEQSTSGVSSLVNQSLQNSQPQLAEQSTKVSSPRVTQKKKETLQKKLYKRKREDILPEWIDREIWESFLETRKKKATEHAKALLIKKLEEFRDAGDDPNEVLKRSIMNGWMGIFPLDKKGGQGGTHRQNPRAIPKPGDYTEPDNL